MLEHLEGKTSWEIERKTNRYEKRKKKGKEEKVSIYSLNELYQ